MDYVFFNSRDQLLRISIHDIVYFEGDGNFTFFVTPNKMKGTVSLNLSKMEEFLAVEYGKDARIFFRMGKRFIINTSYIYAINVSKQKLILSDYKTFVFQLPVSKEALRKMKDLLLTKRI